MRIWIEDDRLRGDGASRTPAAELRSIGGAFDRRRWTFPLTLAVCEQLRAMFGDKLVVDPKVYAWAHRERLKSTRRDVEMSTIQRVAPALADAIASRPYQIEGVKRIARQTNIALLDDPGLGKTAQVLGGIIEGDRWFGRHLVVCPKTATAATWGYEIAKWTDGKVYIATDTKASKDSAIERFMADDTGARFLITNPETLRVTVEKWCVVCKRWLKKAPRVFPDQHFGQGHRESWNVYEQPFPQLFGLHWDSVLADEADRYLLKIRPRSGKMPAWGEGLSRLTAEHKIAMTGTPFRGAEQNIFGMLRWLEPKMHTSYWRWVETWFDWSDNGFGREIDQVSSVEDFGRMLDRFALRRSKIEVRDDLPDNLNMVHWVTMTKPHRTQYKHFEANGWVQIEAESIRGQGVLSELSRLKQFAFGTHDDRMQPSGSPKLDWLIAALETRGVLPASKQTGEMKYIVASQFTYQLDWISRQLTDTYRLPHLMITGNVTGTNRAAAVESFRGAGGPRVLLIQTMTASSITLDEWCDEMFILDETWTEDDQIQLRGRIDNRGQRVAPRIFHYLRTRGTIDEQLAAENLDQAKVQAEILDGRRGIDALKRLMGR